jgi:hypothetical protein
MSIERHPHQSCSVGEILCAEGESNRNAAAFERFKCHAQSDCTQIDNMDKVADRDFTVPVFEQSMQSNFMHRWHASAGEAELRHSALTIRLRRISPGFRTRANTARWPSRLLPLSQRIEQMPQSVMIQLVHQRDQAADFTRRESFTSEPAKIMAWQVSDQTAFVLPVRHFAGNQKLQVFRIHRRLSLTVNPSLCGYPP